MRVAKQWTDEHRTTRNTGGGRWKVTISHTANHQWLHLQWAHEHRAWQADWHQVVFSYESRFNLWDHDDHIRVRRYAGDRRLPDTPGAIFQQGNACPHVEKAVPDFCSVQHMQILPWLAYSSDISPIEHVWDLVGRRLA
ncbi:transposable element Tcb2 transposase [Trichonephila clavipes]|nr:transposable element Tcb2 transposase [Trichonephila clavipes]